MAASPAPFATPLIVTTPVVRARDRAQEAGTASDEQLFEQASGGDRDALGTLITRYEKMLFGLLTRLTAGDSHRADDLFQETFLHAMRAAGTFNRQKQFKPWITAIAVNLVRDDARKRKVRGEITLDGENEGHGRRPVPEPVSEEENPGVSAERKDEQARVRQALERLTSLEREVVLLHFFNSMTLAETAESLDVPLGTVKSRLHAALTRLSGMLPRPSP